MKISEEMKKRDHKAWEMVFRIFIKTIKENNNIDYTPLDILVKELEWYSHESLFGIIIFEAYTFLEIIKNAGLTDDNYQNKEEKFNNAIANIKLLSNQNYNILMLPKPSKVLYTLKYYLYHHFNIDKDTTKYILDEISGKNPLNSRMPKNNNDLNERIKLINDLNIEMFNTHEGREKWKYLKISIFTRPEFRNMVYNDDILNKNITEEFSRS